MPPGGAEQRQPDAAAVATLLGLDAQNQVDLSLLLERLEELSRSRLESALEDLERRGTAFDFRVRLRDTARLLRLRGQQAVSAGSETEPASVIWLEDVTEVAGQEAAVKARAKHLRAVLDALPVALWLRDESGTLVNCNRAYATAVDHKVVEVVDSGAEFLGKTKGAAARALAEQARSSGEACSETHHVVIDGARRLMEICELPFGEKGTLGFAVDRTQLEEVQAELGRYIRVQSEMLENLSTAIAIYGRDLRLMFANTAYARLWDIDEGFLQSNPHLGDVLEALRERRRFPEYPNFPAYKREILQKYATLIAQEEELVHLPDGSTLRMVITPHPFGGVLTSYEDVTDRLALERSYNTLTEVQRETIDNLHEGIAVYGADGRLKLFNPGLCSIWNLDPDYLRGEPHIRDVLPQARDLFPVADEDWDDFATRVVARTTEPDTRSGRHERTDGAVVDWAQVPLPDGGVLFSFIDVTDTIRVERALIERNEALETTDRLKSEFIANISYELRTPLNAIIGFAEVLENQFFGALNERQMEYSEAIVKSSQQLIALINDILDLASIEAGYLHLDLQPTNVFTLLESIFTLGRERAHSREIDLRLDCAEDTGELLADGRRLRQAMFNLLSNALKFTKEGGVVTIAARREEGEMLFVVTDTGIGIPREDQERVFGKFERGTRDNRQAGAGLGLSLVKSLIELHGGEIEMESEVGGGTKVTCHVPITDPPVAPLPTPDDGETAPRDVA
ncbi:PAS domain-containing protein [Pelagibius litoralis]|uniref:histidine kinase n=2 Tax=Pelagibius litoralis TaxID=374515 RepID=A0A967C7I7_9PROT|nr:PAS domain-containing protein [Pelagibius litoralis]